MVKARSARLLLKQPSATKEIPSLTPTEQPATPIKSQSPRSTMLTISRTRPRDALKQAGKEERATDKEIEAVRAKLRQIQSVSI